jgi:hypothetical protein
MTTKALQQDGFTILNNMGDIASLGDDLQCMKAGGVI